MVQQVEISSSDYWFKVVSMLQQNWALIEFGAAGGAAIFFIHDRSGVFDVIQCDTVGDAEASLIRNGFARYAYDFEAQKMISPPEPPFHKTDHPNGPIYSSGRFWK